MRQCVLSAWLVAVALSATEVFDDFSSGMDRWEPLLANHWQIRKEDGNERLVLVRPGKQRPPLRRPTQYALLKGAPWWDVTIDASIKTLRPDKVKGRDVCLVFGYRDDTHFYYAHICSESNGGTHNVLMKVDGKKRHVIMREKRPVARLTSAWHHARVTHQTSGEIKVYVDDMETPIMTARDREYPVGRIGLASFDDPAMFDDVKVTGRRLDDDPGTERVALFAGGAVAKEWRKTFPVPAGDGHVVCEIEGRLNPAKGDGKQPGGWWHFLEYQDADGDYLTGDYGKEALSQDFQTVTSRAYLPTGVAQVVVGIGRKGQDIPDVRSVKVWHERPKIELVEPLPEAKIGDNTPRFAWCSRAERVTVEVSSTADFADAKAVPVEDANLLFWPQPLAPGTWHWRVRSVDGVVSGARTFEQTAPVDRDCEAPRIAVRSTFMAAPDGALAVGLMAGDSSEGVHVEATVNNLAAKVVATPKGWSVQPGKGWKQGLNRVRVRAVDKAANAVERQAYVTHISPAPPKVSWSMHEGVQIEGRDEPFFPLAMYMVRDFEMPRVKAAGFNLVQHYGADGAVDPAETRAWLQAAAKEDLKAFVAFNRKRLLAGDLDFVAERVGALMGEPALLAWYLFDEPELIKHGLSVRNLVRVRGLIGVLDPFHPVLLTCYHEHYLDEYACCYDAYLTQAYHDQPAAVLAEAEKTRVDLAKVDRAGSVIVSNQLPFLPYEQMRIQAALVALEQNGVFFWGWWDDYRMKKSGTPGRLDKRFAGLADMAARRQAIEADTAKLTKELGALVPLLMAPGDPELTMVEGVLVWRKKVDGRDCFILANPAAEEKTVDVPGLGTAIRLQPYGLTVRRLK
jgi:hypothetical protein